LSVDAGFDLYSVPEDSSAPPVRLSAATPDVTDFVLTPDHTRVVYIAGGIFSVALDGSGSRVRVDGGSAGPFPHFAISPDSSHVVFERVFGNEHQLYSTPLTSTTAVRLDDPSSAAGLREFALTP